MIAARLQVMTTTAPVLQGVATTGIYCVSSCVARPHPRNVTPYATSVAAEAAGYRPCLRCRPDRLPEPHLPDVAPPAVAHALVLIADGYLDTRTEDTLARTVGYSGRQLRRLFLDHVGATPAFVARSRRAHFARRLLDETDLPLSAVATAAGYRSTRQLHRGITEIFAFAPSELRAKRRSCSLGAVDGGLALRVPYRRPLDLARLRRHVAGRAIPGVERLGDDSRYRRTIESCGFAGLIDIDLSDRGEPSGIGTLEVVAHLPTMATVIDDVARCRHLLGLDAAIDSHETIGDDELLGPELAARPGLRVPGCWDRFETLIRIVVGQQISVAGASTMAGRLAAVAGRSFDALDDEATNVVFPSPAELAEAELSGLGFTDRRIATVHAVSRAVADGTLDLYGYAELDELVAQYCDLPGVGPWTAQLAAMRLHRHRDAFPAGDLGIRKGVALVIGTDEVPTARAVTELAERWRPHRSLAAQLLWAIADEGVLP